MANSQNGWPASPDRRAIGVEHFEVAGVAFPGGIKAGDVATVFRYLLEQFHARVEPLQVGTCWGHAYRAVTAGASLSNHASGTAADVNAPQHPYGKRLTFNGVQRATIRAILQEVDNVVRWGGDYAGVPDDMHFEINRSAVDVARVATRLRNQQQPPPAPREEQRMITFYARGQDKPDVYCITVDGSDAVARHVTPAEWGVAGAAGQQLKWIKQADMDAFLLEQAKTEWTPP
jgi:D-alanyl-D-alanine carboxypeptidase